MSKANYWLQHLYHQNFVSDPEEYEWRANNENPASIIIHPSFLYSWCRHLHITEDHTESIQCRENTRQLQSYLLSTVSKLDMLLDSFFMFLFTFWQGVTVYAGKNKEQITYFRHLELLLCLLLFLTEYSDKSSALIPRKNITPVFNSQSEKLGLPHSWQCLWPGWMQFWATWSSGSIPVPRQEGWNETVLKVCSNPNHSVTVWSNRWLLRRWNQVFSQVKTQGILNTYYTKKHFN